MTLDPKGFDLRAHGNYQARVGLFDDYGRRKPADQTRNADLGMSHDADEQAMRQAQRLVSDVTQLLTRVDRTLANNKQIVVRDPANEQHSFGQIQAPAWSMGESGEVYIDFRHEAFRKNTGDIAFAHMLGLNYHELAHLFYTPVIFKLIERTNGRRNMLTGEFEKELVPTGVALAIAKAILRTENGQSRTKELKQVFNLLEDGRIEKLIVGKYSRLRHYLTITFATMVALTTDPQAVWAITVPRYEDLPGELVDVIEDAAKRDPFRRLTDTDMDAMKVITRRYNKLSLPRDDEKAAKLIYQFDKYMKKMGGITQNNVRQISVHADKLTAEQDETQRSDEETPITVSILVEESEQDADRKKSKGNKEKAEDAVEAAAEGDGSEGEEGEKEGSGASKSGKSKKDAQGDTQGQGEGDTDSDSAGDSGSKEGTGDHNNPIDDILQALAQAASDILQAREVKSEIESSKASLRNSRNFVNTRRKHVPAHIADPLQEDILAAKKIGQVFERLQTQLDPGWDKRRPVGKLNAMRYMADRDLETGFDNWKDDQSDAASVEMLLLIDMSGSMSDQRKYLKAARAAWVLRRAIQKIRGHVTLYGFDTRPFYLAAREELAKPNKMPVWGGHGGTQVVPTLDEIKPLIFRSRAKSKLVVIVTDGNLQDNPRLVLDSVAELRHNKVTVVKFDIGTTPSERFQGAFDYTFLISDPMGMIEPTKDIVKKLIRKAGGLR